MSHPTTLFIDSSVRLAEHINRKLSAEVRASQAAEKHARKRGDEHSATRHHPNSAQKKASVAYPLRLRSQTDRRENEVDLERSEQLGTS
jgi:hypothetical protein